MKFTQSQNQSQQQLQQQRLTTQQVQFVHMLEIPIAQVEQEVEAELTDNPALEIDTEESQDSFFSGKISNGKRKDKTSDIDSKGGEEESDFDMNEDSDNTSTHEDVSSSDYDDYSPATYNDDDFFTNNNRRVVMENTLNSGQSDYELLMEQVNLLDLDDRQKELMTYLLGMLDADGLLRKSTNIMAEELVIYQGIDTSANELQQLINKLKTLDPAGIGAQSLQECLIIQVERRKESSLTGVMLRILKECYNSFITNKTHAIYKKLKVDEKLVDEAISEIKHLNPRPGANLSGTSSDVVQQIIPDFFVETEEGKVTFRLNYGKVPPMAIAEDFDDIVKKYEGLDREQVRKKEYEAFMYAKSNIKRATAYIQLVQLRFRTLHIVMQHIINHQKKFFLTGDNNDLKPLLLRDIAEDMDYDISTISRACNNKYVQTEWGIFPMKHFFAVAYTFENNDEEYTLQQIYSALREIIESENKSKPYSDEKLTKLMNEKGFAIARRTVTKHREKIGIPVARLRKK